MRPRELFVVTAPNLWIPSVHLCIHTYLKSTTTTTMCSTSKVNEMLHAGVGSATATSATVRTMAAHQIKANRDLYRLVDVREADERQDNDPNFDVSVPLGALLHAPEQYLGENVSAGRTNVLVCGTGHRAQLAAQDLASQYSVTVLQGGLVGWKEPAAVVPDFLVVLGRSDSTEKLSLALAAAAAATEQHKTVAMVLMGDGVEWFLKDAARGPLSQNVQDVAHGEPFKPCAAMLKKFLGAGGGILLACTTCVKHRGYAFGTDMMDAVNPMQMPDLIRMMGQAKGGVLQFL